MNRQFVKSALNSVQSTSGKRTEIVRKTYTERTV